MELAIEYWDKMQVYLAKWNEAKVAVKLLLGSEAMRSSPSKAADLVLSHAYSMLGSLQAVRRMALCYSMYCCSKCLSRDRPYYY